MEGIKRLEINANNKKQKIRAFLSYHELKAYLEKKYQLGNKDIVGFHHKETGVIASEKDYSSWLKKTRLTPLEIQITIPELREKRKNHPTQAKQPKKQKKAEKSAFSERNLSNFICSSKSLRQLIITNTFTWRSFVIRNKLFSKSSRWLCCKDQIIITGGRKSSNQSLILNISTRTISLTEPLNTPRYWHVMGYINGYPAVIGGVKDSDNLKKKSLDSVEIFYNGKWTAHSSLNNSRSNAGCSWFKDFTYVLWGSYYDSGRIELRHHIEKWNGTDWEILICDFVQRFNPGFFVASSTKVIIFGGLEDNVTHKSEVFVYDFEDQTAENIEDLDRPDCFTYNQIALHGNELHLVGSLKKHIIYKIPSKYILEG